MAQKDITGATAPFVSSGVWRATYDDTIVQITPGLTDTPNPDAPLLTTAGITIDIHYNLKAFFSTPDHSVTINIDDLIGGDSSNFSPPSVGSLDLSMSFSTMIWARRSTPRARPSLQPVRAGPAR